MNTPGGPHQLLLMPKEPPALINDMNLLFYLTSFSKSEAPCLQSGQI